MEDKDDYVKDYNFISDSDSSRFPDYNHLFITNHVFANRKELIDWVTKVGFKNDMYFAIRTSTRGDCLGRGRVLLTCEKSGSYRKNVPIPGKKIIPRRNTFTKRDHCPFQVLGVEQVGDTWKLLTFANRGKHNHKLGVYKQWHRSTAKLSQEENEKIAQFRRSNMKPKQMLKQLKLENPDNVSNKRHIHNALQNIKRKLMGDFTPLQYFFQIIGAQSILPLVHWHRREDGTNSVGDLLYAHPKATDLLRLSPYVVLIDATYRTNVYNVPLLEVIGLSPTGHNFHVAFGFMKNEKTESFLWAMRRVKELFDLDNMPGVIVTDREWALMNASEHVFPSSTHMLCRRHIGTDVEKYVTDITKDKSFSKAFSIRWSKIVDSLTQQEYNVAVAEMVRVWSPKLSSVVDYVHRIWLDPYRERFVSVWTKNILHFGARTTNRVESAHAQLKSYIGTATGAFHVIFPRIHDCIEAQLNEIKREMEKSRTSKPHILMYHLFSNLTYKITRKAIGKIQDEYDRCKYVGVDSTKCGCELRTSYGLPCAHEMSVLMSNHTPIDLNDIHVFWRTLDMEVQGNQTSKGWRKTASEQLDELVVLMKEQSEERQQFFANAMYRLLHPESTNLEEPIHRPHKGRPKNNPTKRHLSGWEHSQKKASKGKKKRKNETDNFDKKDPTKRKGQKKGKKNANDDSFFFASQVPPFSLKFITGFVDVNGDGNCGFRVIATFEYNDEEKWIDIRKELIEELETHAELYKEKEALGDIQEYDKVLHILNWWKSPAPVEHWYEATSLGMIVATKYQKIVTAWTRYDGCHTFLPLENRSAHEVPTGYINMARIWGNHFIALHMSNNVPLPAMFPLWIHHCDSNIKHWVSTTFKSQLDHYKSLLKEQNQL